MARPSLRHRATVAALRPFRLSRRTAEDLRRQLDKRDARWTPPEPPEKSVRGLRVTKSEDAGWPVWTIKPAGDTAGPRGVVVGIHGGAYIGEIQKAHWDFFAGLARDQDVDVVVPVYPLAPHGTAGQVVPAIADLIEEQVRDRGPELVGVVGDSAGAGIGMAASQLLVQRGSEVPARLVMMSPWLDVTISDPRSQHVDDPLLSIDRLREAGRLWAGDRNPADPLASPINGELTGLPAMFVYAGTRELVHPDVLRLRERAEELGLEVSVDLRKGLIHGWTGMTFLPEAREVADRIVAQAVGQPAATG